MDLRSGTLTIDTFLSAATLKLAGGALVSQGNAVTVTDAMNLTGSSLDMTGGVLTATGATIQILGQTLTVDNAVTANSISIAGGTAAVGVGGSYTANTFTLNDTTAAFNIGDAPGGTSVTATSGTVNVNGDTSFSGDLRIASGTATLGAGTAQAYTGATFVTGGRLNIDAALATTKSLNVDGGTIVINQPLTTVGPGIGPNALHFSRYSGAGDLQSLNFDGAYTVELGRTFTGVGGVLADVPSHEGVACTWQVREDIADDYVPEGDNFQYVWTGSYTADETGDHLFRVGQRTNATGNIDDDGSFYVDVNGNGAFEAAERILTAGNGQVSAALTAGQSYNIAIGFRDGTGGQNFGGWFSKPSDAGAWTNIDPSNATQAGLWSRPTAQTYVANGTLDINATLTTAELFVEAGGTVHADAAVVTSDIVIYDGAVYNANFAGSAGSGTVDLNAGGALNATAANSVAGATVAVGGTIDVTADGGATGATLNMESGGYVNIGVTQTGANFPSVALVAGSGVGGDLTGADYEGDGQNVTLAIDAVLAATAGPLPTRIEAGGATLYQGITDPSVAATYNLGDNGVDSILKAAPLAYGRRRAISRPQSTTSPTATWGRPARRTSVLKYSWPATLRSTALLS